MISSSNEFPSYLSPMDSSPGLAESLGTKLLMPVILTSLKIFGYYSTIIPLYFECLLFLNYVSRPSCFPTLYHSAFTTSFHIFVSEC